MEWALFYSAQPRFFCQQIRHYRPVDFEHRFSATAPPTCYIEVGVGWALYVPSSAPLFCCSQ